WRGKRRVGRVPLAPPAVAGAGNDGHLPPRPREARRGGRRTARPHRAPHAARHRPAGPGARARMSAVHVIGAGLAGLSAAVRLTQAGRTVHLYEAAPRAGGRCRSYFEPRLDCIIDNGGHVILGANAATLAYVDTIGSR